MLLSDKILLHGVQSRRNVRESRRFMKNHVQIYVPKCHRTYAKHLLNLLKSSIPDIFTFMLTIFSVKTLEKVCQTIHVMVSAQNSTVDFPVSKNS